MVGTTVSRSLRSRSGYGLQKIWENTKIVIEKRRIVLKLTNIGTERGCFESPVERNGTERGVFENPWNGTERNGGTGANLEI